MPVHVPAGPSARLHRPGLLSRASYGAVVLALGTAAACSGNRGAPPPAVKVLTQDPAPITLTRALQGRTAPYRVAEVRARVDGVVQTPLFVEGADVKEGQLLFQIDPLAHEAAYDRAWAQLARAEARLATARLDTERHEELQQTGAEKPGQRDDALAAVGEAEADVAAARAAVESACFDVAHAEVTSPIAGRIGRAHVSEGAYVRRGQRTLLATIQQLDPMYVEVTPSSGDVARLRADLAAGRLRRAGSGAGRVKLVLADGSEYRETGTLELTDVAVDQGAGSRATVRAIFPNPRGELLPGMSVRASVEVVVDPRAVRAGDGEVTRGRGS